MLFLIVKIPDYMTVEEVVERLKQNSNIEFAEPNYRCYPLYTSSDPLSSEQWKLENYEQTVENAAGIEDVDMDFLDARKSTQGRV